MLAGFIGLLGNGFFNGLFIEHAAGPLKLAENVVVGPIIAVLSFVCSIGNVPLAAVLWSGGIGFAGVVAFLFADLIVIPIVLIYRKYYGGAFTRRIVALMFVSMIIAALAVDGLFSGLGLIPHARPARADIFSSVNSTTSSCSTCWRRGCSRPCSRSRCAEAPPIRCAACGSIATRRCAARAPTGPCSSAPSTAATPMKSVRATTFRVSGPRLGLARARRIYRAFAAGLASECL